MSVRAFGSAARTTPGDQTAPVSAGAIGAGLRAATIADRYGTDAASPPPCTPTPPDRCPPCMHVPYLKTAFAAIGGEPFVELGSEIMDHSPGSFSMVASIANDNLRYLPTPEIFERYPDLLFAERTSIDYGYYKAQFTCLGRFRAPYKPDIGQFQVNSYLDLAESLTSLFGD